MLCQQCQKRLANVYFTQVVNNKKVEMYLCEQCAEERRQLSLESSLNINDFFAGLMGLVNATSYIANAQTDQEMVCSKCGMSFDEFQKTGKMGCSQCYQAYGDKMRNLLKRLHGNITHNGKMPAKISKSIRTSREIDVLKDLLNKAIQNEEYEKAAEIRDKIKSLEVT